MHNKYNIKEINYIKGIAILLIFIGHAATPSFLERPYFYEFIVQLIYSFHMPLFFLVSGFLSYKVIDMNLKENYFNFVKAKFYRLAVPFLTISFILVYFLIGLYFRKYCFNNKEINIRNITTFKKVTLYLLSLVCILSYSYIMANQIHIHRYILNPLRFLCGLLGMILILVFIEKICNLRIFVKTVSFLGKHSLDIYLLSWFFQIASMILINNILKIDNYNIFFISNMLIGSLCIPFSIYILRRFRILKFLFLGENSENNLSINIKSLSFNN